MLINGCDLQQNHYDDEPISACIGYFDGVHRGHQALIAKTVQVSKKKHTIPTMITFDPDPFKIIHPHHEHALLSDPMTRLKIAEKYGIKRGIIIHFDLELAKTEPKRFIELLSDHFKIKDLICGQDFRYGALGKGDHLTLKANADGRFDVHVVAEEKYHSLKIASRSIREALKEGDLGTANAMLGYDYFLKGKVISGLHNGQKLAYPTANIQYDLKIQLPKGMVYGGYVKSEDKYYRAMINLGHNPTVFKHQFLSLEAHLLDFEGDLYNREVLVYFVEPLREEKTFANIDALKAQLESDRMYVQKELRDGRFIL